MQPLIPHFIQDQWQAAQRTGSFQAYTLFIDLSGFTMLTETLFKKGHDGAEQLSIILNNIFKPMVALVYAHQGFIPYFAGDAFTAIFKDDQQVALIDLFVETAFELRSMFWGNNGAQHSRYGTFPIRIKIGMSYGTVNWGIVGKDHHQSFYFSGTAIEESAKCQLFAKEGDIVVQKSLYKLLADRGLILGEPVMGQYMRLIERVAAPSYRTAAPALPAIQTAVATHFLPNAIIQTPPAGEFRNIVTVFLGFEGVSSAVALDNFAALVLEQTAIFSGYFKEIDISDKGNLIALFFGAPIAFENNEERALACVLAIQEGAAHLALPSLRVRIGMSSGIAYTGIVGGAERCQYAVVGSRVNLAARLMMAAEWDTILTDEVLSKIKTYKFAFKGNLSYKGIVEAVPTFELLGINGQETTEFFGQMVGREEQLETLNQFFAPLLQHQFAGIAYLYGEAGVGKSRLAYELHQILTQQHALYWLTCPCDQILRKPFNPFVACLRQFFNQSAENSPAGNIAAFEQIFNNFILDCQQSESPERPTIIAELVRTKSILAALVGISYEDSLWEELDAKGRFDNVLVALQHFLVGASLINPLLLVIEDIHWLDDYSNTLLQELKKVMTTHRMGILVTARYYDDGALPTLFDTTAFPTLQLDLNMLTPEALLLFAEAKLRVSGISAELIEFLLRATNGNPFYTEQLLEYCKENNLLRQEADGHWNIADNQVRLSSSIGAVLTARIDRLSAIVKETVKAAAVIGREFELPILTEVMRGHQEYMRLNGNTTQVVSEQVKTAERVQIWRAVNELRYIFKHSLLREAVYDMQLRTRLRELHFLIAQAIEKLYDTSLEERYVDLAYHYEQAEKEAETNFYLKKAADYALRNFQNRQALQFYQKLYQNYQSTEDREGQFYTLLKISQVLEIIGEWQDCEATLQQVLQQVETLHNKPLEGRAFENYGRLQLLKGNYDIAATYLEKAVAVFAALADHVGLSKSYGNLGNLALRQGNYEQAKSYFLQSIQLGRPRLKPGTLAQTVSNLGLAYMNMGNYEAAIACQQEQLSLCQQSNDKSGMAILLTNMGIVYIEKGDYNAAQSCLEEGLYLSKALGNKQLTSIAVGCLGSVYEKKGDYPTALTSYQEDLRLVEELGDRQGIAIVYGLLGNLYGLLQEYDKAIEYLTTNLQGCRELGYQKGVAKALNCLADVYARTGAWAAAIQHYTDAIQVAQQIGNKLLWGQSMIDRANVHLQEKNWEAAGADIAAAYELATALANEELIFSTLMAKGHWYIAQGDKTAAQTLLAAVPHQVKRQEYLTALHKALSAL